MIALIILIVFTILAVVLALTVHGIRFMIFLTTKNYKPQHHRKTFTSS